MRPITLHDRSNFVNKSKVDDVFGMSNVYNEIK